jgi:hypothetical protein
MELFAGIGIFHTSSSRISLQFDNKCNTDLVPFLHVLSMRRNHKKSCHSSLQPCHMPRKGSIGKDMAVIHK